MRENLFMVQLVLCDMLGACSGAKIAHRNGSPARLQGEHVMVRQCAARVMTQQRSHAAPPAAAAQGKFLVLGGLKAMNGQLEFLSADEFETLNAAEHFMCTNIEWDPTGRFVATSVTSIHQMENGFSIWAFNGTLLYRRAAPRPLAWLPPCLLLGAACVSLCWHAISGFLACCMVGAAS